MLALLPFAKLFFSLLPVIFDGIQSAEATFGANKGAQKLAHAVELVSKAVPADQVEHAETLQALLPIAISGIVDLMNKKGELPPSQPAPLANIPSGNAG